LKLKNPLLSKAINCLLGVNFTEKVTIILEKNNLMNTAPEMLSPSHWSRWEFCYWLQL